MNETVLVVGAAGGVGLALARKLVESDYAVIATVLNEDESAILSEQVKGIHRVIQLDLSSADNVKIALDPVLAALDRPLAGVVVCAGIAFYGPLETTPLATLRKTLEVNAIADVAVYQACMPHLRKSQGRLIMIVSNAGRTAIPFLGHYVASKFALEGLGDVMRREAAPLGVKVILIEPGSINTPMQNRQAETIDRDIANLNAKEMRDYGYLYKTFAGLLQSRETGMAPSEVAGTIMEALRSATPRTRYQLGQDAIDTINMALTASDEDIDEFYRSVFDPSR